MCYVCRHEIGAREGYAHFCQHFRARPGTRCDECDRCDLYRDDDDEAVILRAAKSAEREWLATHAVEAGQGRERLDGVVREVVQGKSRPGNEWDRVVQAFLEAVVA